MRSPNIAVILVCRGPPRHAHETGYSVSAI